MVYFLDSKQLYQNCKYQKVMLNLKCHLLPKCLLCRQFPIYMNELCMCIICKWYGCKMQCNNEEGNLSIYAFKMKVNLFT